MQLCAALQGEEEVWLQLLTKCAKSRVCQPGLIQHLGQQLAHAQDQLQSQQQRIQQLEQQVAQQQADHAEMRMQLQQLVHGNVST